MPVPGHFVDDGGGMGHFTRATQIRRGWYEGLSERNPWGGGDPPVGPASRLGKKRLLTGKRWLILLPLPPIGSELPQGKISEQPTFGCFKKTLKNCSSLLDFFSSHQRN